MGRFEVIRIYGARMGLNRRLLLLFGRQKCNRLVTER